MWQPRRSELPSRVATISTIAPRLHSLFGISLYRHLEFPRNLLGLPSVFHFVLPLNETPHPLIAHQPRHHVCHVQQAQLHPLTVSREVLLGITGKDFTLIAASKAAMRGATILKASDDKTRVLNTHSLMAFSGEAGDTGTEQ